MYDTNGSNTTTTTTSTSPQSPQTRGYLHASAGGTPVHNGSSTASAFDPATTALGELMLHPGLAARRLTVTTGKVLYEPHHEAKFLYFVHRGQVRTYRVEHPGHGRLLEILGPDEWCGEAALARQGRYGEQAVAVTPSIITEVAADRLLPLLSQQPRAAVELMKQVAAKLAAARADADGLVFDDCNVRLLKTLLRFSHSAAAVPHADGVILRITHEQLAQAVGVARETVSLAITHLRRAKVLRTGRNQLVYNPENLRTFVRGAGAAHRQEPERDPIVNGG
jgi:CRP/FNR family transcriptional regulator